MTGTVHTYATLTASGPEQMAWDEVLLEAALAGQASLRFYHWQSPTLSLGYFQAAQEREILSALPWLRRASGGGMILHGDGDITYSLALPAGGAWHGHEPWLCRMHHIVQRALASLGVRTRAVVCGEERQLGPGLCFLDQTPGDLLVDDVKVLGSAQRRQHGAILQHGTLRLKRSQWLPDLPGLAELSGKTLLEADLPAAIVREFHQDTDWQPIERHWQPAEHARQQHWLQTRYENPDWNEKR
jgi:lipoyl(octanoyl) transferase